MFGVYVYCCMYGVYVKCVCMCVCVWCDAVDPGMLELASIFDEGCGPFVQVSVCAYVCVCVVWLYMD